MNHRPSIRFVIDVSAAIACLAGSVVAFADIRGPIAPFVVLAGAVLGCGWAMTGWLDTRDAAYAASLTVAAGIALIIVISMIAVELGWWHPVIVVGVLSVGAALSNGGLSYRDFTRETRP
ncbi:MAG TPA: hypothetical protein VK283_03005 [Acidimicrobiales bacterium]|nr:hypothetical protein [Acidimicrobiales bacterium]